ncbi:hypothetical protein [Hamadaea tsunoensis]|uniref:hypothetical protein n=1 Tax=Hamadaea tsunoensis TaxID=53368 RepID=UPI000423448C|nr:hypothetical protein [Hamadaea tsunoensis]
MEPPETSISVRGEMDMMEAPPPPGARRRLAGLADLLLLAAALGAGAGYQLGDRRDAGRSTGETATVAPVSAAVNATGRRCSQQLGLRLQLGVEVVNRSGRPVRLQEFAATLPLGGMRVVGTSWGACGELSPASAGIPQSLPPGAAAWMSAVFDVYGPCPAPDPVSFTVLVADDNDAAAVDAGGFADLGDVPYSGCGSPAS